MVRDSFVIALLSVCWFLRTPSLVQVGSILRNVPPSSPHLSPRLEKIGKAELQPRRNRGSNSFLCPALRGCRRGRLLTRRFHLRLMILIPFGHSLATLRA